MARTAQIHYQRVTLSFPKDVLDCLREKVLGRNMSKYVADAVSEKLSNEVTDVDKFFEDLEAFSKTLVNKSGKSSLELIREDRYGKR